MNKILAYLIILFLPAAVFSQPVYILNDSSTATIKKYAVLGDRAYSFDRILSDPTLVFNEQDSLRPNGTAYYWLKIRIKNPFHYAERYVLTYKFNLDNTLYYFDENTQKWVSHRNGLLLSYTGKRNLNEMDCVLQGQTENIIYIKVDARVPGEFVMAVKPEIKIEKAAYATRQENVKWLSWVTCITVLLLFFLNNLYIYFSIRDKTVLFYLISQLASIFYITSYKHFYNILFSSPDYTFAVLPSGVLHSFDFSSVLMHASVALILYSMVKLTQSFLDTKKTMPVLDRLLRIGLFTYGFVTLMVVLLNVFVAYLEDYTLLYHNILALLVTAVVMYAGVIGYLRKLPAATPFLLANFLPLVCVIGTTLYHVFVSFNEANDMLLPDFAIISQALAFSVALVARTKSIHKDLKAKETEARQLEFDLKEIGLRQKLIELENQKINADIRHEKTRNELLEQRLEVNQRELASATLYMVQKNELLASLKTQIQELNKLYPDNKHQELKSIESILQSNLYLDGDWRKFKLHFEQVHPHFFENLLMKHPGLTKNEIRLYAYFHINLSTKEIAVLLNIDPASVRRAKTRLYKKMAITEDNAVQDDVS